MSNMTYCKFRNTRNDLNDIKDEIHKQGVSGLILECDDKDELRAMIGLRLIAKEILDEFDESYQEAIEKKIKTLTN